MQLNITLEPNLAETLHCLAAVSSNSPENLALELLRDAVKSAVLDPELLGIDGEKYEP
jgi:hypothetical protein